MTTLLRALFVSALLLALPLEALAQDIVALKKEVQRFGDPSEPADDLVAEIADNLWKEILLVQPAAEARADILKTLAFSRGDLQTGASSGGSGSTAAVVSPLLPALFGVAFEDGAITRSVSGSTVTLKANPAKLFCASAPGNAAAVARREPEACRTLWSRVGVTATLDMARGAKDESLAGLESLGSQLSEIAVRVELWNRRDVTLERVEREAAQWQKKATELTEQIEGFGDQIAGPRQQVADRLTTLVNGEAWKTTAASDRVKQVSDVVRTTVAAAVVPETSMTAVRQAWLQALENYEQLELAIANALVVTGDYAFQHPDLAAAAIGDIVPKGVRPPNVHTGRVVAAKGWPRRKLDVTANLSASWFGETRVGMPDAFRDLRAGVEGKFKLRTLANYGAPTLSFAGLYVFLNQEPLGLGLVAFNQAKIEERGHIGLFQTKLEFPAANNTIRIPLSITVSNRTELIKESDVRGQIGVSFNLDALFAAK